jgi:hypothetical protein
MRVNTVTLLTCGTYAAANQGIITVRTSGGGATQAAIANGGQSPGSSQQTHFTVPASHSAVLFTVFTNVDSSKTARLSLAINIEPQQIVAPFNAVQTSLELVGVAGSGLIELGIPSVIPQCSDIWMKASVAVTDAAVSGGYALMIVDDRFL